MSAPITPKPARNAAEYITTTITGIRLNNSVSFRKVSSTDTDETGHKQLTPFDFPDFWSLGGQTLELCTLESLPNPLSESILWFPLRKVIFDDLYCAVEVFRWMLSESVVRF